MAKKAQQYSIKWTPKALETFEAISLQLIERWNVKTAFAFDKKVDAAIKQLEKNPKIHQVSKTYTLRKCVVHKNVSLIYKIRENTVELILFIDNRDNHDF